MCYAPVFIRYVLFLAGGPQKSPPSPIHVCFQTGIWSPHERQAPKRERERHTHSSCERFGNSVTSPPPPKHVCALAQLHTSHTLPCSRLPLSSYDCQTTPPPTLCCLHRPLSSHGHKTNQTLGSPVILCVGFSSPLPPLVFIYDGNISCSVYFTLVLSESHQMTESSEWWVQLLVSVWTTKGHDGASTSRCCVLLEA